MPVAHKTSAPPPQEAKVGLDDIHEPIVEPLCLHIPLFPAYFHY